MHGLCTLSHVKDNEKQYTINKTLHLVQGSVKEGK